MDPEERQWIRGCQRGNRNDFEPLVLRYRKRAYFTALGLLGNTDDAMETSQEAFLRAFRALGATYLTLTHSAHINWADSSGVLIPSISRFIAAVCFSLIMPPPRLSSGESP